MKLFPSGTLKKKADAYKTLSSSILLGSLENEELTNIEILTLSQHARDCAHQAAMENYHELDTYEDLNLEVQSLLENQFNKASEFISIEEERIVIGVNAESVDDRAVDRAMLMLVDLEHFEMGSYHIMGDPIKLQTKV